LVVYRVMGYDKLNALGPSERLPWFRPAVPPCRPETVAAEAIVPWKMTPLFTARQPDRVPSVAAE